MSNTAYVIEVKGYEAIENARLVLKQKGYKVWHYTDKDCVVENSTYIIYACPTLPNESVGLSKMTFEKIDKSKFNYILTTLDNFPSCIKD